MEKEIKLFPMIVYLDKDGNIWGTSKQTPEKAKPAQLYVELNLGNGLTGASKLPVKLDRHKDLFTD